MDLIPIEEGGQRTTESQSAHRQLSKPTPSWGIVLGVLIVGLLVGWFAGRNGMKTNRLSQKTGHLRPTPPDSVASVKGDSLQKQVVRWLQGKLPRGSSLYNCLVSQGVSPVEVFRLQKALKPLVDLRECPPGSEYKLALDRQGKVVKFTYQPDGIDLYLVRLSPEGKLRAFKDKPQTRIVKITGKIHSSLYESIWELQHSPELAMQLADIFAWQIDFLTEPRSGDEFKLIVEEEYRGRAKRPKRILAAQYQGKLTGNHTAIFFCDPSGHCDYYTPEGKSLRKAFLRAPLKYRRISSRFSYRRLHPILRVWRPHLGIDYAAPLGTPVSAIADGVVIKKGQNRDGGKFLKLRHPNGYTSFYCHLSRYAKGIKPGVRVKQGEVIAYVGSTGLSTGPHLYFALSKNGKRINFLKMKLPSASSVNPKYLAQFNRIKEERLAMLNSSPDSAYVVLQSEKSSATME